MRGTQAIFAASPTSEHQKKVNKIVKPGTF